jgi:predicted nucleic acid-binding protein
MNIAYLVDTDWVIHHLNGHPTIIERLQDLHREGLGLSVIALQYNLTLLSNNRRHFERIEGLRIESV